MKKFVISIVALIILVLIGRAVIPESHSPANKDDTAVNPLDPANLLAASSTTTTSNATPSVPSDWMIGTFVRASQVNPIIKPNSSAVFLDPILNQNVFWESGATFNPGAVVLNGNVCLLYRAESSAKNSVGGYTSRMGFAQSSDGLNFTTNPAPVFYPTNDAQKAHEWPGGCEDPRIVQSPDGLYVMMYTQYNGTTALLAVATSPDLVNWTKYGYAFAKATGANGTGSFGVQWSKSGSIVTQLVNDSMVAVQINGKYWMYWGDSQINMATSDDLINWQPVLNSKGVLVPLITKRNNLFDSYLTEAGPPSVLTSNGIVLIYNGMNSTTSSLADPTIRLGAYSPGQVLTSSSDPSQVLARTNVPFMTPQMAFEITGQYSDGTVFAQGLVYFQGQWYLYYGAADAVVGVATTAPPEPPTLLDWELGPFERIDQVNPIITPNATAEFLDPILRQISYWERGATFNPGVAVRSNTLSLFYRAEDTTKNSLGGYTSRFGLAQSTDGINFTRDSTPVFYPENDAQKSYEWPGGCEDPRIVERSDGLYVMTYTQYNGKTAELGIATSPDLVSWTKQGYAFLNAKGANGKGSFGRQWSKSGAIVTQVVNGQQIAALINGQYWMYWGDSQINMATSSNLISWQPILDSKGDLIPLISKRPNKFDSNLTEAGPPAVLTSNGIVLIYNGMNSTTPSLADPTIALGAYSPGQVLTNPSNPMEVLARSDTPFLTPQEPFETIGQYPDGTVFAEGLVQFNGTWFLYYGGADSTVGVASYTPE